GPNEIPTSRNNVSMDTGFRSFEVEITASVTDPDVTELRSELLVEGLPAGAQVFAADGTLITPNAEGRLLIGAEQLIKNADGSLVANIKVTVPADVDSFTVQATAYAGTGESENMSGTGSATVTQGGTDGTAEDVKGEGGSSGEGGSAEPETVELPALTSENLLANGDFQSYNKGRIGNGFTDWKVTGNIMETSWMMQGKPYVGLWSNGTQPSTFEQSISGVTGGSAVEFQLAWNDTWHRNHAAGKSVTFEIEYAGKVFAQVTTPSDSGPANYDA